jgi:hypothetical protein
VIVSRTVRLADPLARANVVEALRGPGGPAGVVTVDEDGDAVTIRFDDAITAAELVDDLVTIESVFVPARAHNELTVDEAAAIAAAGLGDPELDGTRVIERYLDEEQR